MNKAKSLYIIDGSSYIFRAYFGIRQFLSTSKGFPTNALYGFINMLQKVVKDEQPVFLCVAFDSKEKTFRHDIYPEYKANRDAPPEDLAKQFPYFEPLVEAYNISSIRVPGFEADDIIASGKADMVALARAMMADPRWAWHAANSLGVDTPWSKMYLRAHPRHQGQFFPRHDGQPIR